MLEQVLSPCPSLLRHALRLRSFVPGEFQDEDGDSATQFILADPPPSSSATSFSSSSRPLFPVASPHCDHPHIVFLSDDDDDAADADADDADDADDDDASFFCDLCLQNKPLHSIFLLTCSCLFCRPCLRAHAESVLVKKASQIGSSTGVQFNHGPCPDEAGGTSCNRSSEEDRITSVIVDDDSSSEPLESISCPNAGCIGRFSLSSAQLLAPEAFRF